jgi:quercetin dioxygenase-like cupin family protein
MFDSIQRIVTGIDDDGHSCVVSRHVPEAVAAGPGLSLIDTLFETSQVPPPSGPAGQGEYLDLGVAPGLVKWFVVEYEPGASFSMHHADTIDFDTVLAGSLELVLDDGVHALGPGDCVVMTGVGHAWRAGTDGCRMGVVMLGTLPRSK